jgi:hypothetical protein
MKIIFAQRGSCFNEAPALSSGKPSAGAARPANRRRFNEAPAPPPGKPASALKRVAAVLWKRSFERLTSNG